MSGEVTYLAALVEVKPDVYQAILDPIVEVLNEFFDLMPAELLKKLLPRRAIDHKIELIPEVKPPAQAPY